MITGGVALLIEGGMDIYGRSMAVLSHVRSTWEPRVIAHKAWRDMRQRCAWRWARTIAWAAPWAALLYRPQLRRVIFIGVTGSCGKTTTRELIAAVLASHFQGRRSRGNSNLPSDIAKTVLSVRPWDDFCLLEIAAAVRGSRIPLESSLRLARPQIGVVTNIGTDHITAFRTVEAIAAEKGKLISALPVYGTAILNADDPRVLAMRTQSAARVITYGLASEAMVRAENVRSAWPERLSFTVLYNDQSYVVQTQLCGAHWVPCVLAALAVGIAMKVPLAKAVQAIQRVLPSAQRMSPVSHPDGVTFIRDDAKAPLWSIFPALQFVKEATARRKIVIIGTISDYAGNSDRKYVSVARQALAVADYVIFAGPSASKCLKARQQARDGALQAFYSVEAAGEYLRDLLQPGDLVLLKGADRDRLGDVISARTTGIARRHVEQRHSGEANSGQSERQGNAEATDSTEDHADRRLGPLPKASTTGSENPVQAVVGLGNMGKGFQDTPHNIGQRVLDLVACSLGGEWTHVDEAMVARVDSRGRTVYMIKPLTSVNDSGRVLRQLGHRLGFRSADCVLVQDDIDLPLGMVRARMQGGDGGHRGVRSVLQVFRTDVIRRVRVGVGRPDRKDRLTGYILEAFSPADIPTVERACTEAADRVLDMITECAPQAKHGNG